MYTLTPDGSFFYLRSETETIAVFLDEDIAQKVRNVLNDKVHCVVKEIDYGNDGRLMVEEIKRLRQKLKSVTDSGEYLWVVLANVNGGDWKAQSIEWQEAAAKARDNFHRSIK